MSDDQLLITYVGALFVGIWAQDFPSFACPFFHLRLYYRILFFCGFHREYCSATWSSECGKLASRQSLIIRKKCISLRIVACFAFRDSHRHALFTHLRFVPAGGLAPTTTPMPPRRPGESGKGMLFSLFSVLYVLTPCIPGLLFGRKLHVQFFTAQIRRR